MPQISDLKKCPDCLLFDWLCVCKEVTSVSSKMKLTLLLHKHEAVKTTNSGALAARCLQNSEVYIVGAQEKPIDWKNILDEQYFNMFMFPSNISKPLDELDFSLIKKPLNMIVPDGNWAQATKMYKRFVTQSQGTYQMVTLPVGKPTNYRLRIAKDRKEGLATMEAIARAYGILESSEIEAMMERIFRLMVERNLYLRGNLAADLVFEGLPKKK